MKDNNFQDEDLRLTHSDPFHSPTERLGNEAGMRRLFLVEFNCPLCGQEHSCELYLTLEAQNEDQMMKRALETLERDDVKVNSLAPFMKEYHQRAGDYLERATGYARRGIRYPFQVTRVIMTDEESYTCEYCDRKFETICAWRQHDGRDPVTGEKARGETGLAFCQRQLSG